jgi:hypothetical protein
VVATIGDIAKKLAEVRSKLANGDCLRHTLSVPSCVHARKRPLRQREWCSARAGVATQIARTQKRRPGPCRAAVAAACRCDAPERGAPISRPAGDARSLARS